MDTSLRNKLMEQVDSLPYELQRRVFDFVEALVLSVPKGVHGKELERFAGTISPEDLQLMSDAIEEGCEKIDWDEW